MRLCVNNTTQPLFLNDYIYCNFLVLRLKHLVLSELKFSDKLADKPKMRRNEN